MKQLILELLDKWACKHDWACILETDVHGEFGDRYTSLTYVCRGCGKFKRWKSH